jgi:phage baseplate assembly protein gpV
MPEADEWDSEAFDNYIAAEVRLPKNGEEVLGKVVSRKRDHDGNPTGRANRNPILDTRLHQVTFPDGEMVEYSANVIAECLYSQVDSEGNQFLLLDEFVDWKRTPEAVTDEDILQVSHNGNIHKRCTTKGGNCVSNGRMALPHGSHSRT